MSLTLNAAMPVGTVVPTPSWTPRHNDKTPEISIGNKQQFRDVRQTWAGPLNTQIYDDKLVEMSNQSRNHLYWLARNKQYQATARPHTARAHCASGERPFSRCSWTNTSVMFTSPAPHTASPRVDDMSSIMSTSSKVLNFCYLCSSMEEHQRNHLKSRAATPVNKDWGSIHEMRQHRLRYVAPVPPRAKKRVEEPAVMVQEALYKITVWTGDLPGASTDANVYITIVGDQGALLKTRLWHRQGTNKFSFVRGSREVFHVKGPRLGSLRTVTVEHDGMEQRHGWYLERVEVQCMLTKKAWIFPCKNWLSLHLAGDPAIQRELPASVKERVIREFEVVVETGKKRFAGTDANVYITLQGTEGSTGRHQLTSQQNPHAACFQRGQTDRFKIQVPDVGELRSLRIEHDGERAASSWYLNKVTVRDVHQPQSVYHFVYNGWLAKDMGDGRLWRELRAIKQRPNGSTSGKSVQYEVIVKTGDIHGAGTTADIYVVFAGTNGKTGRIFLSDSTNNFERSKIESFMVKAANVGNLKSVRIGLDTSGPDAGWFCDHIRVRKRLSRQEIYEELTRQKQAWKEAKQQAMDKIIDQEKENAIDSTSEDKKEENKENAVDNTSEDQKENEENAADSTSEKENVENAVDSTSDDKKEEKENGISGDKNEENKENASENRKDEEDTEPMLNTTNNAQSETPRRKAGEKTEAANAGRVFDENGRVLRIPVCEEYVFPCSKWFASDRVDGLFERELPVQKQMLCYQER